MGFNSGFEGLTVSCTE